MAATECVHRRDGGAGLDERARRRLPIGYAFLAATLLAAGCERVDHAPSVTARPIAPAAYTPPADPRPMRSPVRTIELGCSVKGVPLTLEVFGDGSDRILIFGGIHGSEPTSATLAAGLADHLRVRWELFAGKTVAILAEANPDGLAKHTRANANGVDLNRNFPAENWQRSRRGWLHHGSASASEPETQAIIRAVELIHPNRIIAIHSARRGRHCNNFDGPARELAQLMERFNGYPVTATMGYPTPGSFGSWAGIDRELPTITLELPNDLSGRQCWRDNADALLAFIRTESTPAEPTGGRSSRSSP